MKTKIAVLVSGNGTNLQALMDAQKKGILVSGEIVIVIASSAKAYALKRAADAGIPAVTAEGGNEEILLSLLKESGAEMIILAGYLKILSQTVIASYAGRIINVHPALIPSFCGKGYYGLKVHEAVLKRGVRVTGATVHLVNEIPDGGKILLQKAVEVHENDTPEILQRRVMEEAEWKILPAAAEMLSREIAEKRAEENAGRKE